MDTDNVMGLLQEKQTIEKILLKMIHLILKFDILVENPETEQVIFFVFYL